MGNEIRTKAYFHSIVEGKGGKPLVVTVAEEEGSLTADKTCTEILEAQGQGRPVYLTVSGTTEMLTLLSVNAFGAVFGTVVDDSSCGRLLCVRAVIEASGAVGYGSSPVYTADQVDALLRDFESAGNADDTLVVTLTPFHSVIYADKKYAEIEAAMAAGKTVVARSPTHPTGAMPLVRCEEGQAVFASIEMDGDDVGVGGCHMRGISISEANEVEGSDEVMATSLFYNLVDSNNLLDSMPLAITVTQLNGAYSADKDFMYIAEAYEAGREVTAFIEGDAYKRRFRLSSYKGGMTSQIWLTCTYVTDGSPKMAAICINSKEAASLYEWSLNAQ